MIKTQDAIAAARALTARRIYVTGLWTGLGMREMRGLAPGFILDAISVRARREEALHGVRRKKNGGEW